MIGLPVVHKYRINRQWQIDWFGWQRAREKETNTIWSIRPSSSVPIPSSAACLPARPFTCYISGSGYFLRLIEWLLLKSPPSIHNSLTKQEVVRFPIRFKETTHSVTSPHRYRRPRFPYVSIVLSGIINSNQRAGGRLIRSNRSGNLYYYYYCHYRHLGTEDVSRPPLIPLNYIVDLWGMCVDM